MPSRSRSFDSKGLVTGSTFHIVFGTESGSMSTGLDGTCDDVVGNRKGTNNLLIIKRNRQYPRLYGALVSGGSTIKSFNGYPIGYRPGPVDPSAMFPAPTTLQMNNWAWRTLAEGNPSAADISLPTFLAELKDMPSLVKNWYGMFINGKKGIKALRDMNGRGDSSVTDAHVANLLLQIPEIVAAGHLTWRWAISPFVRDVNTLLDASRLIQKRVDLLNKLANGRSIRTRVALGKTIKRVNEANGYLHTLNGSVYGRRVIDYTEKVWGTVRYSLQNGKLFPSMQTNILAKARRLVLGITTHEALATAWELMPWSWFVDWFAGIGTVIKATNNSLGLSHGAVCIMRHASSVTSIDVNAALTDPWIVLSGEYKETYDRKERYGNASPILPFAPTYLPVLTGKALSILGSLFVLQQKPGKYLRLSTVRTN